jgi:hypothetical protein
VPASLLHAAFDLPRRVPSISLPESVATVSDNPARATGLTDRGRCVFNSDLGCFGSCSTCWWSIVVCHFVTYYW